jgi:hypothetical protein
MKQTIKEAAREARMASAETLTTYGTHTSLDDFTYLSHDEIAEAAFIKGADWRINSVWHDASERPDKGKMLIVEDIDSAYDLVYLTKSKPWEELSEKNHYMRWAYIEDLLPNMED